MSQHHDPVMRVVYRDKLKEIIAGCLEKSKLEHWKTTLGNDKAIDAVIKSNTKLMGFIEEYFGILDQFEFALRHVETKTQLNELDEPECLYIIRIVIERSYYVKNAFEVFQYSEVTPQVKEYVKEFPHEVKEFELKDLNQYYGVDWKNSMDKSFKISTKSKVERNAIVRITTEISGDSLTNKIYANNPSGYSDLVSSQDVLCVLKYYHTIRDFKPSWFDRLTCNPPKLDEWGRFVTKVSVETDTNRHRHQVSIDEKYINLKMFEQNLVLIRKDYKC